jgi:hypothetical protein
MTTDPHPSPTPTHPLLDPDPSPGWTPAHGRYTIIDNRPSEPHEHRCLSIRCQGDPVWTCTKPRCFKHPLQYCAACDPTPPMQRTPTPLLRYDPHRSVGRGAEGPAHLWAWPGELSRWLSYSGGRACTFGRRPRVSRILR